MPVQQANRTAFDAAAAFSHAANLAGCYEAFAAACREAGILLLEDTDAMILLATLTSRFAQPTRPDVAMLATSDGGGAITADRRNDLGVPTIGVTTKTLICALDGWRVGGGIVMVW